MHLKELDFAYPEELVATERAPTSRVMWIDAGEPRELDGLSALVPLFRAGDCLVVNDTRVLKRRVFSEAGLEILFLSSSDDGKTWDVLCPATRWKDGVEQVLPGGVRLELVARGKPQKVRASEPLSDGWFEKVGELPLPPYIQKARGERHNRAEDSREYQTAWARKDGSLAAPTASLHFSESDIVELKARGVKVVEVTLHVGLGTFLPVTAENLNEHEMHGEIAEVTSAAWSTIQETRSAGGRVWALGTTVVRTIESVAHGLLASNSGGGYSGQTHLFIRPGFEYRVVDVLMTNFHQPRSTLLALVAAFAGLENVKRCYAWAIERKFRLFSYGDLSVWTK